MPELSHLLEQNRAWAERAVAQDADFFKRLVGRQTPKYLWIGCADSRVPANQIVDLDPGELFVHRNLANVVVHTDLNCLSVVQFAVEVLGVEDIIVCGHYGCGGVEAALKGKRLGLSDHWLRHIEDVHAKHHAEIGALTGSAQLERLCELNVCEQVANLSQTAVVQNAWARGQKLSLHGWVYSLAVGLIHDLGVEQSGPEADPKG